MGAPAVPGQAAESLSAPRGAARLGAFARELAWALPAGALAALVALRWPGVVTALGKNIPQPAIVSDYAAACLWALAIGVSIRLWPVRPGDRPLLAFAWAARCFVTLVFMLAYEWNYDALDTYAYFDGGRDAGPATAPLRLGSGTENITALVALHARLHLPYFHAIKVSFSLLGFVGVYVLYRGAVRLIGREAPAAFALLTVWPSVLFWSSILGKDPVVFLGIAVYVYGVLTWYAERRRAALVIVAAGVVLAMSIRLWLGPILLAPFGYLLTRSIKGRVSRWATVAVAACGLAMSVFALRDLLVLETVGDLFSTVDTVSRGWAEGGSGQQIVGDLSSPAGLIAFLPRGMFTALFRPLPGEVNNAFGLLAGLESAVLLALLVVVALRITSRDLAHPLVQWALLLIVCWSGVYSVLSYQNLGTAVRFRLQILPVLLGVLAALARDRSSAVRTPAADGRRLSGDTLAQDAHSA